MLRRLIDSPWLYFGLAGLLAIVAVLSMVDYRGEGRPTGSLEELDELAERDDVNVVFVLIDTLRADRMSAYGYERPTSPYMDDLASKGIRFEHVEAQSSWTKTSMASLWTSVYPQRTGVLRFDHAVPTEPKLPSEIFQEAGFHTTGIIRNGWVEANFGFARGFDTYIMPHPIRTPGRFKVFNPSAHPLQGNDENLTETAREFLRSHRSDRFFLYVHYMDVHQYTYDRASGLFGSSYGDAYDNSIHWTDRNVGGLLQELRELDLLDETVIVIASDHGEAFWEHGNDGHARNLYQEVTETPWIVSLPFALEEPAVVDAHVANVDIWPTVLDLLGLPPMEHVDGRSVLPLVRQAVGASEAAPNGERSLFAQLDRAWGSAKGESKPLVRVVKGSYRYLYDASDPESAGELYDQSEDPGEKNNLVEEKPEIAEALRREAQAHLESGSAQAWSAPEVQIDEMRRRQLQALGYMRDGDGPAPPDAAAAAEPAPPEPEAPRAAADPE